MKIDLSDLISKSALKEEIENGKDKPSINDGMDEVFWMEDCIEKAPPAFHSESVIAELKKYRDLEEQGKLLRLPCKVGDMVYAIQTVKRKGIIRKEIWDYTVTSLHIERDCNWNISFEHVEPNGRIFPAYGEFKDIGKNAFLTKEEAEAALQKMIEIETEEEAEQEWISENF